MKKTFILQQQEISFVKNTFTQNLIEQLGIIEVQGPILSEVGNGMQDNLSGIEKAVQVNVKCIPNAVYEVVHSLAKWKRHTLARFHFKEGEGLFVHMKALRPDEDSLDQTHSVYVDQWDWEKVIPEGRRNFAYLKETVRSIYRAIRLTELAVEARFDIPSSLPKEITFVHSEDLVKRYPDLSSKERENAICKEYGAVFLVGIGDILVWNAELGKAFELSSMGIRVDESALRLQVGLTGDEDRLKMDWHQDLLNGKLPLTIGGGIGQSRLAMLLLHKKHIGEVQSSVWPKEMLEQYQHIL